MGPLTMFFVYVIKSEANHAYYVGSTENVEDRLARHNRGASNYTKNKRPWVLKYTEEYKTKKEAFKREKYLKSLKNKKALEHLIEHGKLSWE